MDLYECLDVPRDADAAGIHRAYRRAAKRSHPDAGGSQKAFAMVKHARDVLTDPRRRERYDRTGEAEEVGPDPTPSLAMQMVNSALDEALGQIESEGRKAHQTHDLAARIIRRLVAHKAKATEAIRALEKAVTANEALLGRFSAKEGESRIDALVRGRIAIARGMIADHRRGEAALNEAIKIVEAEKFRADAAPIATLSGFSVWAGPF